MHGQIIVVQHLLQEYKKILFEQQLNECCVIVADSFINGNMLATVTQQFFDHIIVCLKCDILFAFMKLLLRNFAFMKRSKFCFYTIARRASRKCCTTKFVKRVPSLILSEFKLIF